MELKYLRSELDYQEEILTILHQDFEIWYRNYCKSKGVDLDELNRQNETRITEIIPQPKFSDLKHDENGIVILRDKPVTQKEQKKFTGLFKQVAKVAHPDKVGGNGLDFAAASAAYEMGDWSRLLEIAENYNIIPENIKELIPLMSQESRKLRHKIQQNQQTYSWRLHNCKTKNEKNKVMICFVDIS